MSFTLNIHKLSSSSNCANFDVFLTSFFLILSALSQFIWQTQTYLMKIEKDLTRNTRECGTEKMIQTNYALETWHSWRIPKRHNFLLEKKASLLKKSVYEEIFSIEEEAHKSSRLRLEMSACY